MYILYLVLHMYILYLFYVYIIGLWWQELIICLCKGNKYLYRGLRALIFSRLNSFFCCFITHIYIYIKYNNISHVNISCNYKVFHYTLTWTQGKYYLTLSVTTLWPRSSSGFYLTQNYMKNIFIRLHIKNPKQINFFSK